MSDFTEAPRRTTNRNYPAEVTTLSGTSALIRRKRWDLCQVHGCKRQSMSKKKERDLAKRFCHFHFPEHVETMKAEVAVGRLLRGYPKKAPNTACAALAWCFDPGRAFRRVRCVTFSVSKPRCVECGKETAALKLGTCSACIRELAHAVKVAS
jgi:hypothetical protein